MILITRPRKDSIRLKHKLTKLGYDTHIESLSSFTPIKKKILLSNFYISIISSPRAADIILAQKKINHTAPLLIIGSRSFNKFEKAGFKNIINCVEDSDALIKYIKTKSNHLFKQEKYTGVCYFTGTTRSQSFINKLSQLKLNFKIEEIYTTNFSKSLSNKTYELIRNKKIKIILLYSYMNAKNFCELLNKNELKKYCNETQFLVLSKKIKDILVLNGFKNIIVSKSPNEANLIKALEN